MKCGVGDKAVRVYAKVWLWLHDNHLSKIFKNENWKEGGVKMKDNEKLKMYTPVR